MKALKFLFLLLPTGLLTSCTKDYNCTCETTYDTGSQETSVITFNNNSKHQAEDACNSMEGPFSFTDIATGYLVTANRSCSLE